MIGYYYMLYNMHITLQENISPSYDNFQGFEWSEFSDQIPIMCREIFDESISCRKVISNFQGSNILGNQSEILSEDPRELAINSYSRELVGNHSNTSVGNFMEIESHRNLVGIDGSSVDCQKPSQILMIFRPS